MNMDYDEIQEPERGVADAAWRWTTCWNRLRPSCSTHCWRKTRNWARKWALWQAVDAKLLKAHWRPSRRWWLWRSLSGGRRSERQRRLWFGLDRRRGSHAVGWSVGGLVGAGLCVMSFRSGRRILWWRWCIGVAYWYSALQNNWTSSSRRLRRCWARPRCALSVYVAVARLTLAYGWLPSSQLGRWMNRPAHVRSAQVARKTFGSAASSLRREVRCC